MQQKKVTFYSEGAVIVADIYWPDELDTTKRHPALVQCQGFTGIRCVLQPAFAARFTAGGYVTIAIDYRGWGESGGERNRFAPLEQVEDVRNALTYLETVDFVDPERLGVFGVSFGALIAPYAAAMDKRVKANVGWVGVADGYEAVTNRRTPEEMKTWEAKVAEARRAKVLFNDTDRSLTSMDVFTDEQTMAWQPALWEARPDWRHRIGFDSIGRVMDFRPIDVIHLAEGRATMMLVANNDSTGSPTSYRTLFAAAREPKYLTELDCGHYDMYDGALLDQAMTETLGFLAEHL